MIPKKCCSELEEAKMTVIWSFFQAENKAGNIDGKPDGLGKMWIIHYSNEG
jgi:hypothetical protein